MRSQALRIVSEQLQEIARVADALDTTAAHLAEAHKKQQLMIERMRREAQKNRAVRISQ